MSRLLLHLILTVIVFLLGAANVRANEQLLIVQSEAGDPLLKGLQATMTSFMTSRGVSGLSFTGSVENEWTGDWVNVTFRAPANGPLHPGVYDNTIDRSSSIEEDALPGLSVSLVLEGSGTFPARGRFEVLKVTYSGSDVVAFYATFSLKVDGASGGLTGEIRLNSDSTTPTVNQAPGISAGGVLRVLPNIPVELPGIASDDNLPAGSALSYQWTGPIGVTFDNANVLRPIARFQDVGTYQLYFWAFDGSLYGYTDLEVHVLPPGIETVLRIRSVLGERCFGGRDFTGSRFDSLISSRVDSDNELIISTSTQRGYFSMTLGGLKLSPNDLAAPGIYEVASQIEPGKLNLRIEGFEDWASDLEGTVDLRQLAIDSNGNVVALWMYLDVARPRGANPELSDPPLLVEVRYGMPEGTIGNQPPLVTAGRNDKWMQRQRAILTGNVVDDGDQMPALTWTRISGPGDVQFADPNARVTEVNFDVPGTYVFRLTADDGTHVVSDDVTIEKSPLETSLIIRGLPLTAGASTFANVYTAGDIGIYDEYPGSDTSVSLSIRPDGDDIVGLDISSDGQPFRTGVYHNSPLIWNRARARLWLNDPSGPILAYDFVIHEIAFDENKKLTALHAEFRSDRLEAAQEVWAEIRFNALDLSSTGPNLAPRVTVLAPHTVPNWLFKLDGNVFDDQLPANQPIHVTWEQIDGPSPARMDDAHCLQPEVEVEKDGVYRFRLTASDGEFSASAESTVVVGSGSRKYRGVITFFGSAVGRFDLTRRTSESFTARLTLPGTSFPIIGTFENGSWRTSYSNADGDTVEYELKIDDSGTGILGYISIGDLIYELSGDQTQATGLAASKQKAERAGTYNLLLNPTASTAPRGFGFARVIVRGSGAARGTGRLPDGTSFSFSSTSTVGDNLPFFAPMYGREGGLAGEFGFKTSETNGQSRIGASLLWMHPDRPKYPPYTEYFSSRVNASGDPYSPPVRGTNFLSQKPGAQDALLKVLFDDGELLRIPLRFNSDGTVLPLVNSPGFHFKLKPKTGTFRGAFTDPRDGKQRSFAGIIDSAFAVGGGYFITPEGAGRIQMDSVPVP